MSKEKIQHRTIPFINPPQECTGSYNQPQHCSCCSAYWARRRRTSRPALMAWVIKHCSRREKKTKKREKQVLIWKCLVLLFSKAFICIFSLSWRRPSGHGWGVYRMFCDQYFLPERVCVCACAHACIKSCQPQNTYEEAGESYIWQSAANKV